MKNITQILIMGVSGSGKTTIGKALALELSTEFFDGDQFHSKENIKKMSQGLNLDDKDRLPWLQSIASFINERTKRNISTIIACSALKKEYREVINEKTDVTFVYLKGSKEIIQARLKERKDHFMPSSLLDSQFLDLEEPKNAISVNIEQDISSMVDEIIRALNKSVKK